jgi:protein SCO1
MSSSPRTSKPVLFGIVILSAAGIAVFALYKFWQGAETSASTDLPRLGRAPRFVLIDQDGNSFGNDQLKGKLWVADFICTRCPGADPIMSSRFAELDRNFAKSDGLRLVSFSRDPEYDTPAVLKKYAQRFEASWRWRFLTGNQNSIEELIKNGFAAAAPATGSRPDGWLTSALVLVDRDGMIRSFYDGGSAEAVPRLLSDLGSLLRSSEK